MSETSNHFESVFRELSEHFADIPGVTVTPGEGTPPEQYSINYRIHGVCKGEDGVVSPCNNHLVSIILPPNFPNLPPICHAESPTFHPDFFSSTINIARVWSGNHSISHLVFHIGKMISGEIYSTSDAINQEALEWFESHSDALPFDKTDFEQTPAIPSDTIADTSDLYKIDTSDDNTFADSFSLERGTPEDETVDVEFLSIMARQKRFQALSEILKKTGEQFDGRAELEEKTRSSLNEAMELFQEANDLEHQGSMKLALDKLQSIEELVSDYPLLYKAKKRVKQAVDLLGDWVDTEELTAAASAASRKQAQRQSIDDLVKKEKRKRVAMVIGGVALFLGVIALSLYFFFNSRLQHAENDFAQCRSLLNDDKFIEAEEKCRQAIEFGQKTYLIKQDRKNQLDTEIRALLDSPKMRHGLAGRTLLDGRYVTLIEKELILTFRKTKKRGDAFFAKNQWREASGSYDKARRLAQKAELTESNGLGDLQEKMTRTEIYLAIEKGKKAFSASRWDEAISQYNTAIDLIGENSALLGKDYVEQTGKKLDSILLHATVINDRQLVSRQLQNEQYGAALRQLKKIQDYISRSAFSNRSQFQTILGELEAQIKDVKVDYHHFKLESYLTENYKELFLKHYPSANPSALSNPRAQYQKKVGDKLLFRMQCTETRRGRALRLQMDYLYSPDSGTWRFYGGR